MSIGIIASNGIKAYGIQTYIVDTDEDIKQLRTTDKMGSTAYVINSGKEYILNGNKTWVDKNNPTKEEEE